ncbi:efflux RND transporter permease subunit [Enterovirga sp. GCM10030262]|uniref:efflux RND transporter permease subunit n=1 Tax=Enterovirga sp. GCM10030262 TaxID=3273391 RepID=UPI003617BE8D
MRNISSWAIRNPVIPLVLFAALTLLGIFSFLRMDVNNNPDISFPAANVTVAQPGAAPSELETQVTQRVEAAIRGINGVDEIQSTVREGSSSTFVQFELDTPVDRAVNDVRNAISQIRGDLPEGILEPQVTRIDADGGPLGFFSAHTTDMTLEELSWYVDNVVSKRLLGVEGMAAVSRGGGVSREIRVILDPVKMQSHGITAAQVNQQLRMTNVDAPGGRAEIAGAEQAVRVLGNAESAYDLGQKQISLSGGRTIRLADIATIRDGHAEQRSMGKVNGVQVVSFGIEKAKGSSEVTVHDEVVAELDKLEEENPKVTFTERFTTVDYTKDQYSSAMEALIEGAVLAVIVVFLFLRDWRATVISAIAIPLSAIPAFWFMDLLGFTLNGVTLLALSLVAGVLVDDAIVEIENIVRHMRMGKSAYQASIEAADEIGLAVVATTFSIVAVFLPVAMMDGIIGQYFKSFGLTICVAVLMSLAVARLITPMMAAYFLESHGPAKHGEGWMMDRYMGVLRWSLRNRWKTMGVGFAAFVATIFAFATLPFIVFPNSDSPFSSISVEMPPGATLSQTENVVDQVTAIVSAEPEVQSAFGSVQVGRASVYMTLREDRERKSTDFERETAPKLREIPDARVFFRANNGFGGSRAVSVMLAGSDPELLEQTAAKLVAEMNEMPEIRAARVEGDLRRPEIMITPRFDLAADMGVTTQALSQTIRIATQGEIDQNSAKFSLSDRQIPIRVMLPEESRTSLATIENMPVPTTSGGSVPLKVIADISFGAGATQIQRFNQERRIMVGADLAPGVVEALSKINQLPTLMNLPQGVNRAEFGEAEMQQEMVEGFGMAVVAGIFLVFAVLVLLYKRIVPPFVNMGSLLLAPLGGAIALHLTGQAMSMPVFIGILMLLGIVAKNSILLIDFAIEEIDKGVPKDEAIADSGHKRAQPIVMTTVAMVAGMIPTALALSGDGSFRQPMGIVVIGGLILSTILTLVIVPAGFSLADSFERWIGPKFGRLLTYKGPQDHGPAAEAQPAE